MNAKPNEIPRETIAPERQTKPSPRLVAKNFEGLKRAATSQSDALDKTLSRVERLEKLLGFESQIRGVGSLRELWYCVANEALHLTAARQIFVLRPSRISRRTFNGRMRLCAASNVSALDANAPAVVALEKKFTDAFKASQNRESGSEFTPFGFHLSIDNSKEVALAHNAVLLPLMDSKGYVLGALVVHGEGLDFSFETPVLKRIGEVTQYAWQSLAPRKRFSSALGYRRLMWPSIFVLMILALFLRVPLSTLAPVEIVPLEPEVVAAPIDGVIRKILVDGNVEVTVGTPLFQYEDSILLAELKIAQQAWSVASSKLRKAQQSSFGTGGGKRDLATAQAELDLAAAELEFARAKHLKTIVKAPASGLVILDRKSDWQGRPVSVGQRVLEIARPSNIEARIDLPVSDAMVLEERAPVQLYLDTNPLKALSGEITSASYRASLDVSNQLAFTVLARLNNGNDRLPRIGARGTAQIYGKDVTLGFYLFRRPLAAIRQWIGW